MSLPFPMIAVWLAALVAPIGFRGAPAPGAQPGASAATIERDTTMVLVPAGSFVMGEKGDDDNGPAHEVRLRAFRMDRHEVTNAEYEAFCRATGHKLPFFWGLDRFRSGPLYPDHPVIGVSQGEAADYADWRGKRLPTEAEWEYAARGGLVGMRFVYGNRLDSTMANYTRAHQDGPVAVGSYPPNGYGLHDMAGNVQEWVADRYGADYYAKSPVEDPRGPEKGGYRVVRGGGWYSGTMCVGVAVRYALPSGWCDFNVGFRCARDAESAADTTTTPAR